MPKQPGKTERNVAIALDIAGGVAGAARGALVDRYGTIRMKSQARTLWGRSSLATLEPYLRCIDDLVAYAKTQGWRVRGIGVSLPGSLDAAARRPLHLPVLPSLNNFPLCDMLEARYNIPARIAVDVDAALAGEYYHGAGRGSSRLLYMTLNAVLGAASMVDGRLVGSAQPYTGHVAHVTISAIGPRCGCGKRGCINSFVSQDALQKMVLRALRRDDETSIALRAQREPLSLQMLWEEAQRGDVAARHIYKDVEGWLCEAVARLARLLEPELLILSGSMPYASQTFRASINESGMTAEHLLHITQDKLGRDGALIGTTVPFFVKPADPVTETHISALNKVAAEQ